VGHENVLGGGHAHAGRDKSETAERIDPNLTQKGREDIIFFSFEKEVETPA
jgi:hypothetical protein